jgi:hypothetical protein
MVFRRAGVEMGGRVGGGEFVVRETDEGMLAEVVRRVRGG